MNKIKILIIEDEPDLGEDLQYQLEEIEDVDYEVVGIAPNLKEAKALFDTQKPDIAIVDIMLDGQPDGIKFAQYVKNSNAHRPVIFLTGMDDRTVAREARATTPSNYLLKPFNIIELESAIELAIDTFEEKEEAPPDWFFIKRGENLCRVNYEDIVYVSVDGAYSEVHTIDSRYVTRCSLIRVEQRLGKQFIRTHANYLACIKHITKFNEPDSQLFLIGNKSVPVSRRHKQAVKDILNIFFN